MLAGSGARRLRAVNVGHQGPNPTLAERFSVNDNAKHWLSIPLGVPEMLTVVAKSITLALVRRSVGLGA